MKLFSLFILFVVSSAQATTQINFKLFPKVDTSSDTKYVLRACNLGLEKAKLAGASTQGHDYKLSSLEFETYKWSDFYMFGADSEKSLTRIQSTEKNANKMAFLKEEYWNKVIDEGSVTLSTERYGHSFTVDYCYMSDRFAPQKQDQKAQVFKVNTELVEVLDAKKQMNKFKGSQPYTSQADLTASYELACDMYAKGQYADFNIQELTEFKNDISFLSNHASQTIAGEYYLAKETGFLDFTIPAQARMCVLRLKFKEISNTFRKHGQNLKLTINFK